MARKTTVIPGTKTRISFHVGRWTRVWIIFALFILGIMASMVIFSEDTPTAQPEQQVETVPGEIENPPAQQDTEPNKNSTLVTWAMVEPTWVEAPFVFAPPRGETGHIYNGDSGGKGPTPEKKALVQSILPSLPEERGLFVSVSRDSTAPQYVLTGIHIIDGVELDKALFQEGLSLEEVNKRGMGLKLENKLFLSRNEEKSWEGITLPSKLVVLLAVQITAIWSDDETPEITGLKIEITQDYNSGWQTTLQVGN